MRLRVGGTTKNPAIPALWRDVKFGGKPRETMKAEGKVGDESHGNDEGIHGFVEVRHFGFTSKPLQY
ncbi:MAG: hypothetical protein WBD73_01520, partial [Candidatus Acidiferrales bacterium]